MLAQSSVFCGQSRVRPVLAALVRRWIQWAQDNRDKRVELLIAYARRFFPSTQYLDYAVTVEAYTLQKAANLVMNVDGTI